jgi:hypothetical protein
MLKTYLTKNTYLTKKTYLTNKTLYGIIGAMLLSYNPYYLIISLIGNSKRKLINLFSLFF